MSSLKKNFASNECPSLRLEEGQSTGAVSKKKSRVSIICAMLRRGRDSRPEQAKRVEGCCRGLAQHDWRWSKNKNTYLKWREIENWSYETQDRNAQTE
jgi:hypothetical protein